MRLPKNTNDPEYMLGHLKPGKMLVTINRGDYWQCAMVIRKDAFEQIKQRGIQKFRDDIGDVAPFLRERTAALRDWNDMSLLSVRVDRLRKWWRPGLLCIGDSAHAMSPVGGIGINLAIQDAVATAKSARIAYAKARSSTERSKSCKCGACLLRNGRRLYRFKRTNGW